MEVGGHFPLLFSDLASMYPKLRHFENISENFKKHFLKFSNLPDIYIFYIYIYIYLSPIKIQSPIWDKFGIDCV